jgi:aryl-alcohol dehydrogenase-like predicted oxidoreductase
MQHRSFGRSHRPVSEVGFGAWQISGSWGPVDEAQALGAIHGALDAGIDFIDTADVYGNGLSEQLIAKALRGWSGARPFIATKMGRRSRPHVAEAYTAEALAGFVERSLTNLEVETLDLVQLHCPPTAVYYTPEVFAAMDDLVAAGKIRAYGVSVEKVEEALKAIEYPNLSSVQIVFNIFRQRPAALFFAEAQRRGVSVIVRLPLSSGLLSGKMTAQTVFDEKDHRNFNRLGQSFDRGETFSGLDYDTALRAVEEVRLLVPEGMTMAQFALRWVLMHDAVTVAIPGARNAEQARGNAASSGLPALSESTMQALAKIYDHHARAQVHQRW